MSHFSNLNGKINNKIVKTSGAKALECAIHCSTVPLANRVEKPNRSVFATQSDGSIIKNQESGLKQKLVNKVKSWSNKDKFSQNDLPSTSYKQDLHFNILSSAVENLSLNTSISEENIYHSEIFKAKDSLESILVAKTDVIPYSKELDVTEILQSDAIDSSLKQLAWDPWNKLGRKNRKDKKRKEKSPHTSSERSVSNPTYKKGKDHTAGDEPQVNAIDPNQTAQRPQETYEYQPYNSNRKSVDFVNEVAVMYFTGDEIISKAMEPLKKELDQQIRNKEMRRGHVPCTLLNKKEVGIDDYMSAWFKK